MKRSKRVLSLVAAGALVLTAACSTTPSAETPTGTPSASQPQATEPAQTGAVNGVFEGKGSGYGGELSVLVTVEDGKMTDLRLLDNNESAPVANRAFPILEERILAACQAAGVPAIVAMGRKGGSGVAAAICNALLYAADHTLDPVSRGW